MFHLKLDDGGRKGFWEIKSSFFNCAICGGHCGPKCNMQSWSMKVGLRLGPRKGEMRNSHGVSGLVHMSETITKPHVIGQQQFLNKKFNLAE